MHFLLLAIIASTSILISFKLFNIFSINTITAISVNYLVGALIGFITIHSFNPVNLVMSSWFYLSVIMGFILIIGFILFDISTNKAGIAITSISSRMSVIFSVILGLLLFKDSFNLIKITGFVLVLISLLLIFYRPKQTTINKSSVLIPMLVFLLSGINDTTLKIAQHFYISGNETDYVKFAATSFLIAFLVSLGIFANEKAKKGTIIELKSIIAGIILGTLNWLSIFFMLSGLDIMEVSTFFPIQNIGVVSLSTIAGYFLFRERLTTLNLLGIFTAVIAIALITYNF